MKNDIEKGAVYDNKHDAPDYSSTVGEPNYQETTIVRPNYGQRVVYSFKRDPNLRVTPHGVVGSNGRVYNPDIAAIATATSPLARKLKGRHLQMIAIGGSIGETFEQQISALFYDLTIIRHWPFRCIR